MTSPQANSQKDVNFSFNRETCLPNQPSVNKTASHVMIELEIDYQNINYENVYNSQDETISIKSFRSEKKIRTKQLQSKSEKELSQCSRISEKLKAAKQHLDIEAKNRQTHAEMLVSAAQCLIETNKSFVCMQKKGQLQIQFFKAQLEKCHQIYSKAQAKAEKSDQKYQEVYKTFKTLETIYEDQLYKYQKVRMMALMI